MNQFSHSTYAIDYAKLRVELARLRVPSDLIEAALGTLPEEIKGILIYGSRARGDFQDHSDLDLLALVPRSTNSRKFDGSNVTCYTSEQLQRASGTLFGMHIRRDGIVTIDSDNELYRLLQELEDPDSVSLRKRIRHFSSILEPTMTDRQEHLAGLCRLARFLLRTAIYTKTLDEGPPCFSVRELAERFADPALATILSSNPAITGEATLEQLDDLRARLRLTVGTPPSVFYSSLMTLVIGEWNSDREYATLALHTMIDENLQLHYSELSNVFL